MINLHYSDTLFKTNHTVKVLTLSLELKCYFKLLLLLFFNIITSNGPIFGDSCLQIKGSITMWLPPKDAINWYDPRLKTAEKAHTERSN